MAYFGLTDAFVQEFNKYEHLFLVCSIFDELFVS